MTVTLYTRADWGARAPRCSSPMPPTALGLARHWPGTTTDHLSSDPEDVARYLQGWQDYHMDGRGWCDIAYQYAVDLAGGVWTLRGFDRKSGAHTPWNEEYYAVLCVVGDRDEPTPDLLDGLAYQRDKALDRTHNATRWLGHGQLAHTATECPGPHIRAITTSDLEDDMPLTNADATIVWAHKHREYVDENGNTVRDYRSKADILHATHSAAIKAHRDTAALRALVAQLVAAGANDLTAEQVEAIITTAIGDMPTPDVDEAAIVAGLIEGGLKLLSDADVTRIAQAAADEADRRERERLGT